MKIENYTIKQKVAYVLKGTIVALLFTGSAILTIWFYLELAKITLNLIK